MSESQFEDPSLTWSVEADAVTPCKYDAINTHSHVNAINLSTHGRRKTTAGHNAQHGGPKLRMSR